MLYFISKLYGLGAYLRRKLYDTGIKKQKKLNIPVISVGNLSAGGTGKTPFTIFLAKKLQEKGYRVCVLSRGYRRKSRGTLLVGDGKNILCSWEEAGDEPFLIASEGIPVVVSESRYEGGIRAIESIKPDIFILDDGFQHFQLYRDVNILLIDATKPFWKDSLLPAGLLREPPEFYRYADLFVVNRFSRLSQEEQKEFLSKIQSYKKPFFITEESIQGLTDRESVYPLDILTGKNTGVFSGLGNNTQFFQFVENLGKKYGFDVAKKVSFPDHFDYREFRLPEGPLYWITTEKDLIKIPGSIIKGHNILAVKYSLGLKEEDYRDLEKIIFSEKIKNKAGVD
ncbi:tetraacyldisaccharide 4'-kinase [Persephonella sp.]